MTDAEDKELWEYHYSENLKYVRWWPDSIAIKFFGRLSKNTSLSGKKALDIGCGGGKDLLLFLKMGMKAYGIEISEAAIKVANNYLKNWGESSEIGLYEGKDIPYPDEYFDFSTSMGVLDHMLFPHALKLIKEIHRVLKPGGYICASLHSVYDSDYGKGRQIESNTYLIEQREFEVGLPQHYYDEGDILKLFEPFKIEQVYIEEEKRHDLEVKSTLSQSSSWGIYAKKGVEK